MSGSTSRIPVVTMSWVADSSRPVVCGHSVAVTRWAGCGDVGWDDFGTVALGFSSSAVQQFEREDALVSQNSVGACGRRVAWLPGVDDRDGPACTSQGQGCAETGGSPSDHNDVSYWLGLVRGGHGFTLLDAGWDDNP